MMKWRAIAGAVVLVGGFVALHFLFFGKRISEWKTLEKDAQSNVEEYKKVVGPTGLNSFEGTAVAGWINHKNKELDKTKEEFQKIRDRYPRILLPPDPDPGNYVQPLFKETVAHLKHLSDLEARYAATPDLPIDRVKILDDLDIQSSMVPGAPGCGKGYSSTGARYPTYYIKPYLKNTGAFPRQGAIEFWFKPDNWSTPTDNKDRTLFFARGDEMKSNVVLITGQASTYYPQIYIYKDGQSNLHMNMVDTNGQTASAQGFLDDKVGFRPDRWAYVSCTWNGSTVNLYVNGQVVTGKAPTVQHRVTDMYGYGEFGGDMYGPAGGGGGIRDRLRRLREINRGGPTTVSRGVERQVQQSSSFVGPGNLKFAQLGLGYGVTVSVDPNTNQADGTFDELRIKADPRPSPPTHTSGQQIPGTIFKDPFESEFPDKKNLDLCLNEIRTVLTSIRVNNDPDKSRPLLEEMDLLRAACGMNNARLEALDPSVRFVRRIHVFNALHDISGWPLADDGLFGAFSWLPKKDIDAPYETPRPSMADMEAYVAFLQLAGELVDVAMSDQVGVAVISRISFEGEDLIPGTEELEKIFHQKLDELKKEFPQNVRGLTFLPPSDWDKWREQLEQEAYMQPEISEMMMGGAAMSATAYMGGGMDVYDPAEQERQMLEMEKKIQEWVNNKVTNLHKLEKYLAAAKTRTIPKEVRDEYRLQKLAQGTVTYKKRLLRVDYLCNATALAKFIHEIEYGSHGRLANIENYSIASDPNAQLSVSMVVAFHQVKDVKPSSQKQREQRRQQEPRPGTPEVAAAAAAAAAPGAIAAQ